MSMAWAAPPNICRLALSAVTARRSRHRQTASRSTSAASRVPTGCSSASNCASRAAKSAAISPGMIRFRLRRPCFRLRVPAVWLRFVVARPPLPNPSPARGEGLELASFRSKPSSPGPRVVIVYVIRPRVPPPRPARPTRRSSPASGRYSWRGSGRRSAPAGLPESPAAGGSGTETRVAARTAAG